MSKKGFENLYRNIAITHGHCIDKLKHAIITEDYDYTDFVDMVIDDISELNEFLEDYGLHDENGLIQAMIDYLNDGSNDNDDTKVNNDDNNDDSNDNNDNNDDLKNDKYGNMPMLVKKLIKYCINGDNSKIKNSMKLKLFVKKINCSDLHCDGDKVYNECMKISINNGQQHESVLLMLADNFTRYYINEYLKGHKNVTIASWRNDKFGEYIDGYKKIFTQFESGIQSLFKRLCSPIMLPMTQYIDDDINTFAKIVMGIFDVVSNVIEADYPLPIQVRYSQYIYI